MLCPKCGKEMEYGKIGVGMKRYPTDVLGAGGSVQLCDAKHVNGEEG